GLGSTVEEIENPEGGRAQVSKIPGRVKYPNIVLKFGLTDSRDLDDWHHAAVTGNIQRKDGSIVQPDFQGNENARWDFVHGWPTKWDGSSVNAGGSDLSVETLEIAHEGVERA